MIVRHYVATFLPILFCDVIVEKVKVKKFPTCGYQHDDFLSESAPCLHED